ncbi:MAG: hypothetical protein IJG38_06165 [Thermoguttaceae bacterium]|nr:hypothetical protein [Thermoguttaceae bacterium]
MTVGAFASAACVGWSQETASADNSGKPLQFSGIYPHLAQFNNEGECGTGAVVPWAGRLWTISYGPHLPYGSSDKLYEIDDNLNQTIRPESFGGTHANRMIHKESNQLIIGPYFIDADRNVRVVKSDVMPGRLTGTARHLTDPSGKVYFATMEEGMYEVDVNTLSVTELYQDSNRKREGYVDILPGYHGKGFYSGQDVVIYANNGEQSSQARVDPTTPSGALGSWDGKGTGKDNWTLVRRNQFTEVTGPNGIYGSNNPETDPIWAVGWDDRSVILMLLDGGEWSAYRLPKASHCYDGAHGWNTEWPRIREVADNGKSVLPDGGLLMTMHGMFWNFPKTFKRNSSAGIKPLSSYLKVVGDFCFWNGKIVCGCDDSAKSEFLNTSPFKGSLKAPGQSNSNLWFIDPKQIAKFGPALGRGAVWKEEPVKAGVPSDPYLFAGFDYKCAWIAVDTPAMWSSEIDGEGNYKHSAFIENPAKIAFEIDKDGTGVWEEWKTVSVTQTAFVDFSDAPAAQWIRVVSDVDLENATVEFQYRNKDDRSVAPSPIFNGLATENSSSWTASTLWSTTNGGWLCVVPEPVIDGVKQPKRLYHLNVDGSLTRETENEQARIEKVESMVALEPIPESIFTIDDLSVLLTYNGKRYRLPVQKSGASQSKDGIFLRLDREVATERDLFSCAGTFYELPAANAGSVPKIRPIASHAYVINDYCSWRGLLVLGGIDASVAPESNSHIIRSEDGCEAARAEVPGFASEQARFGATHFQSGTDPVGASVWAGAVDDLWSLGKPRGFGYVWKESDVKSGDVSDPILATGYDKKTVEIVNHGAAPIAITIQANATDKELWIDYNQTIVEPGQTFKMEFPAALGAYWFRAKAVIAGKVSVKFVYE